MYFLGKHSTPMERLGIWMRHGYLLIPLALWDVAQPPDHSKDEAQVAGAGAGTANDSGFSGGSRCGWGFVGQFFLFKAEFSEWNNHQPVFWGINQLFGRLAQGGKDT